MLLPLLEHRMNLASVTKGRWPIVLKRTRIKLSLLKRQVSSDGCPTQGKHEDTNIKAMLKSFSTFPTLTMFILFLILAVFQHYGTSMPIIPDIIDIREALQSGPIIQNQKIRTRFDIIWSCVSTLFICTWVAIHPNIPPRGEGRLRSLWRRIGLMLWTLLVPELILIWAYRQWAAARYIAEYFQGECEVVSLYATY